MNLEMWNNLLARLKSIGVSNSMLSATGGPVVIVTNLALYALLLLLWKLLQGINKKAFCRIIARKGKTLHLEFLQRIFSFCISVFCIVLAFGYDNIRHSLLGSATVLAAIVGFAGQDVIKDALAGLQISLYRPFDIGDRVELEDGSAGIVESITMRHVVLKKLIQSEL